MLNFRMESQHFAGDSVKVYRLRNRERTAGLRLRSSFTVLGGSLGEVHAQKIANIQEKALKCGAPIVGMNDSGGARIQESQRSLRLWKDLLQ